MEKQTRKERKKRKLEDDFTDGSTLKEILGDISDGESDSDGDVDSDYDDDSDLYYSTECTEDSSIHSDTSESEEEDVRVVEISLDQISNIEGEILFSSSNQNQKCSNVASVTRKTILPVSSTKSIPITTRKPECDATQIIWNKLDDNFTPKYQTIPDKSPVVLNQKLKHNSDEYEIFLQLFPRSLIKHIVYNTNRRLHILRETIKSKNKKKKIVDTDIQILAKC